MQQSEFGYKFRSGRIIPFGRYRIGDFILTCQDEPHRYVMTADEAVELGEFMLSLWQTFVDHWKAKRPSTRSGPHSR